MASSVLSERAFSAAGITISKRRNRLKGDVVEALECLKCLLHQDLIFREVIIATELENELENEDSAVDERDYLDVVFEAEEFSWDQLVEDIEEGSEDEPVVV